MARGRETLLLDSKGKVAFGNVQWTGESWTACYTGAYNIVPRGAASYPVDSATKMSAGLLGTTLQSMQWWDVLRSIDYLVEAKKLSLSGGSANARKGMSAIALCSGTLDERTARLVVDEPPELHWSRPAFLNVIGHMDVSQEAALIAPRVTRVSDEAGFPVPDSEARSRLVREGAVRSRS